MATVLRCWMTLLGVVLTVPACDGFMGSPGSGPEPSTGTLVSKSRAASELEDFRRTVVFIQADTVVGQDMFLRGGLDEGQASTLLGRNCTSTNFECAIPIRHLNHSNANTEPWKVNDNYLDWYGREPGQDGAYNGQRAEGSAVDWTTNFWPKFWGVEHTVEVHGHGVTPLNRFGIGYWMLDVEMDCAKALPLGDARWFEVKSYISNGPGWEKDVQQWGAPFSSGNHFAQCGMLNVFRRGVSEAHILPLEVYEDPYIVGASDIAYDNDGKWRTADLLDELAPAAAAVFTAGDNLQGTPRNVDDARWQLANWFAPSWGRHKSQIRPAAGNHDFMVAYGQAYFEYYGSAAGDPGQGYYSYNVGDYWHVVVLNSNNAYISGRWPAELDWLRQDLEAHRGKHVLAYWHQPRFSSGTHGSDARFQAYWDILANYRAEIVVNGHDHHYERFAQQTPSGWRDDANGIRQFIVGTGGMNMRSIPTVASNSELRQTGTWGVLKLTLHESWYEWVFIAAGDGRFVDSGSTFCH
jgi:hypothetical protein